MNFLIPLSSACLWISVGWDTWLLFVPVEKKDPVGKKDAERKIRIFRKKTKKDSKLESTRKKD